MEKNILGLNKQKYIHQTSAIFFLLSNFRRAYRSALDLTCTLDPRNTNYEKCT